MIMFSRALYAEILKLKRTLALLLVVVAPLSVVTLYFLTYLQHQSSVALPTDANYGVWLRLATSDLVLWTLLMLPLYVSLETALLNGLEHGPRNWKLLYTLPIRRWNIYAAKQVLAMSLIALSSLVLLILIVASGLLLRVLRPDVPLGGPIPWGPLFTMVGISFLASWLIISLHLWISARWPSFVVTLGVGIVATTASIVLVNSDYAPWYPWAISGVAVMDYMDGKAVLDQVAMGMAGGILVAVLGAWDVIRRDVV